MSNLLSLTLAALTLSVFVLNAMFVHLTTNSSKRSLNWLYPLSLAFAVLAIAEYAFVAGQTSGNLIPWLKDITNIQIAQDLLYLIAGTSLVFFLRAFREEEE